MLPRVNEPVLVLMIVADAAAVESIVIELLLFSTVVVLANVLPLMICVPVLDATVLTVATVFPLSTNAPVSLVSKYSLAPCGEALIEILPLLDSTLVTAVNELPLSDIELALVAVVLTVAADEPVRLRSVVVTTDGTVLVTSVTVLPESSIVPLLESTTC